MNFAAENSILYPSFTRISIFYVERFFYFFTQFFVVEPDSRLYLAVPHASATATDHFVFTSDPYIFRHLFLLKLPYLIFDTLCAWAIWLFFRGHRWRTFILCLWNVCLSLNQFSRKKQAWSRFPGQRNLYSSNQRATSCRLSQRRCLQPWLP